MTEDARTLPELITQLFRQAKRKRMTATIDYAPPTTTTTPLPAPPTVQCPGCKNVVPHATRCRTCDGEMPDFPFCFRCRTWTAPIDKTTCVVATHNEQTGAKTYAVRGCPLCRNMPPDDFLRNVGLLMTAWAIEVSKLRPASQRPAPTEVTAQPSADLPIRVTTTQSGFVMNETVEYDLPGTGQGGVPIVLTNRERADTPHGKFLKDIAERYATMQQQLAMAFAELDELKAMLDEQTAPEKRKGK